MNTHRWYLLNTNQRYFKMLASDSFVRAQVLDGAGCGVRRSHCSRCAQLLSPQAKKYKYESTILDLNSSAANDSTFSGVS
jgi:recombinational DNA repair protein (RecF pathway)